MGNASVSSRDEAGPSGEKSEEYMEYAHDSYHAPALLSESMVQSPAHSPRANQSPLSIPPQEHTPESEPESPPSSSSYNNAPFSSEDFDEKVPELPPFLLRNILDQPPSTESPLSLQQPSPAILNHFYIQKARNNEPMAALGSTQRFRKKYVTVVLYKSL